MANVPLRSSTCWVLTCALACTLVVALPARTEAIELTEVFNYNGSNGTDGTGQAWTVPSAVRSISIVVEGAQGGIADSANPFRGGGLGGRAAAEIAVSPGETLHIFAGGQVVTPASGGGFNGGEGGGSPGGGASDVRRGGTALADRIMVAGGGGGDGSIALAGGGQPGEGGSGGGAEGGPGNPAGAGSFDTEGGGGTQTAGGSRGDLAPEVECRSR